MNAISKTFPLYHGRAHQNASRALRRDSGVGLAMVLAVAAMTAVGTWGNSGVQTAGQWPGVADPTPTAGWEDSAPPELFPLGSVTSEAPM